MMGEPLQNGRQSARPAAGMTGIPMDGVGGDRAQSHQWPFFKNAGHSNKTHFHSKRSLL